MSTTNNNESTPIINEDKQESKGPNPFYDQHLLEIERWKRQKAKREEFIKKHEQEKRLKSENVKQEELKTSIDKSHDKTSINKRNGARSIDDILYDEREKELSKIEEPLPLDELPSIIIKSCNSRQNKELVKQLMLDHKDIANEKDFIKQYRELIYNKYQCKPCDNFIKVNAEAIKNNTLTINKDVMPKDQTYEYLYNGKIVKRKYQSTNPNSCNLKINRDKVKQYLNDNPDKRGWVITNLISEIKYELGIDVSTSALRNYIKQIEFPTE